MRTVDVKISDLFIPKFDALLFDVLDHKHTHYTLPGGRASSKSSAIGTILPILITQHPDANAVCFRRYQNTLKDSVYAEVLKGISRLGLDEYFKVKMSPMEIIYLPTGQRIMFRGLDDPMKIKSIKMPKGYIAITWWEELDTFQNRDQIDTALRSTMRGGNVFWNFKSYNPPKSAQSWVNKDLLIVRPDRLIVRSTYLDVPPEWLGEQFYVEAEHLKTVNPRGYQNIYMGEVTGTGGQIFDNVKIQEITDEEISRFDKLYRGLDFGYTIDPTTHLSMNYHSPTRTLYIFREYYKERASYDDIADYIRAENPNRNITIADSAEPRSIDELSARDIRIIGAKKGPDSVRHGIKWLQELTAIVIDPARCPNAAKEFSGYEHPLDRNGHFRADYPDKNNHTIDACRYGLEDVMLGQRVMFA